jgi:hypothetical protein
MKEREEWESYSGHTWVKQTDRCAAIAEYDLWLYWSAENRVGGRDIRGVALQPSGSAVQYVGTVIKYIWYFSIIWLYE